VKQALQASADAAVAAGAGNLAQHRRRERGRSQPERREHRKNRIPGVPNVTANITLDCSTSPNFCNPANTVHITETANIPTYFLRIVGINSISESVHAQACSPCGGLPLDVMIVLDRTGSMLQRLEDREREGGILSFLTGMDPTIDNVGLVVLPPATSTSQACSTTDDQQYQDTTPAYLLVPLSNTYATSLGNLNNTSPLVSTVNCVHASAVRRTRSRSTWPTRSSGATDAGHPEGHRVPLGRRRELRAPVLLEHEPVPDEPVQVGRRPGRDVKATRSDLHDRLHDHEPDMCEARIGAKIGNHIVTGNESPPYYESPSISAAGAMQAIASPGNYYSNPNATSLTGIFTAISADIMAGHSRING
jgi:hypothetical protein